MHACFLLQESSKCCSPPINVVVRTAFECASRHMLKASNIMDLAFTKQICLENSFTYFSSLLIPSHVQFVFNEPEHGDYANSSNGKSLVHYLS